MYACYCRTLIGSGARSARRNKNRRFRVCLTRRGTASIVTHTILARYVNVAQAFVLLCISVKILVLVVVSGCGPSDRIHIARYFGAPCRSVC